MSTAVSSIDVTVDVMSLRKKCAVVVAAGDLIMVMSSSLDMQYDRGWRLE